MAERLASDYAGWFAEVTQDGFEAIPVPLGHAERPEVELPGHEAYLHPAPGKGISYVGRNGWANDWVTGWTSPDAYPSWPVDVVQPGRYAVTLLYTCAEANVEWYAVEQDICQRDPFESLAISYKNLRAMGIE